MRLRGNVKGKHIKSFDEIVTKENAKKILEWQQSLPIEDMNSALISACLKLLTDEIPPVDNVEKERVWVALQAHMDSSQAVDQGEHATVRRKARCIHAQPALVLAASLILLLLTTGICMALGVLPWQLTIDTEKGFFEVHIVSSMDHDNNTSELENTALPDDFVKALKERGIEVALPRLLPVGFSEHEVETNTPDEPISYVICYFTKGDERFSISVEAIPDGCSADEYSMTYEMTGSEVKTHKTKHGEYYIYQNESYGNAVWQDGSYICSITGNISEEELLRMIDSIE